MSTKGSRRSIPDLRHDVIGCPRPSAVRMKPASHSNRLDIGVIPT